MSMEHLPNFNRVDSDDDDNSDDDNAEKRMEEYRQYEKKHKVRRNLLKLAIA